MSAPGLETDFAFEHLIERSRPTTRRSATTVMLLALLAITIAAALFVHPPRAVATLPAHGSVIAQAS